MSCGQYVVALRVLIPVTWNLGDTWSWIAAGCDELDDEPVYGCGDLRRVLAQVGRQAALRLHSADIPAFRLVATRKGAPRVVGAAQWGRDADGLLCQIPALVWTRCAWEHVPQLRCEANRRETIEP